eukprot:TRINITY_DN38081_c0_g1_i1.p1 TRINITY_DN38081_c0_g1~~TRINITY_DN38081_c0_g1_i1.p1  ORF type:complete len:904 (+),score=192.73 TRINITY_DN38081_c0_g1_i1:143-2854(+)
MRLRALIVLLIVFVFSTIFVGLGLLDKYSGLFSFALFNTHHEFSSAMQFAQQFRLSSASAKVNKVSSVMTFVTHVQFFDDSVLQNDQLLYDQIVSAVGSWKRLVLPENILVFTSDEFSCDHFQKNYSVRCLVDTPCVNRQNLELNSSCLWETALTIAQTEFITFINPDVLLLEDFVGAFEGVLTFAPPGQDFVMIGQGSEVVIDEAINLGDSRQLQNLKAFAETEARASVRGDVAFWTMRTTLLSNTGLIRRSHQASITWHDRMLAELIASSIVQVVDATDSVAAFHLDVSSNHSEEKNHEHHHHDHSALMVPRGTAFSSDLVVLGKCSSRLCVLLRNEERDNELLAFFHRGSAVGELSLIGVNAMNINFLDNWLCWSQRIGFSNFLFIADDKSSGRILKNKGLQVIVPENAIERLFVEDLHDVEYQKAIASRLSIGEKAITYGFSIMFSDVESVFLDDPFRYVNLTSSPVLAYRDDSKMFHHSIMMWAANSTGLRSFSNCLFGNIAVIMSFKPSNKSEFSVSACLAKEIAILRQRDQFASGSFESTLFPTQDQVMHLAIPGPWPVLVHNTRTQTADRSNELLRKLGLWALDVNDSCVIPMSHQHERPTMIQVTLKVLASYDANSIDKLLESVSNARYSSDKVSLNAFVKLHNEERNQSLLDRWENTAWPYGEFTFSEFGLDFNDSKRHISDFWNPRSDDEILVWMENVAQVSPNWFRWFRRAVAEYYSAQQLDAQMFGIVLQDVAPENLEVQHSIYRHQYPGHNAIAIFPSHWREFQDWFAEKSQDPRFTACIPFAVPIPGGSQSSLSWWPYFNRFVFEKGYYALWTNLRPGNGLVKVRSHKKSRPIANLLSQDLVFPALSELPLFDFNSKQVAKSTILSSRKNLFSSLLAKSGCNSSSSII